MVQLKLKIEHVNKIYFFEFFQNFLFDRNLSGSSLPGFFRFLRDIRLFFPALQDLNELMKMRIKLKLRTVRSNQLPQCYVTNTLAIQHLKLIYLSQMCLA